MVKFLLSLYKIFKNALDYITIYAPEVHIVTFVHPVSGLIEC